MTIYKEPIFDVAQLAHVEILSPKPEETVKFFTSLLGLEVTAQEGQSVYLRAYEDLYHHSLKVTESRDAGLGHVSWRTSSPQALQRRTIAVQSTGYGRGWIEGDIGHGKAYQFTTPDGHMMELLWDVEYYQPLEAKKTKRLNRAPKRTESAVPVRRLDHVNLMDTDPGKSSHFIQEALGFRVREQIVDNGIVQGSWLNVSNRVQDLAIVKEPTGRKGKLHHLSYWYGVPKNLYDIADVLKENDIFIEIPPNKHGINQALNMYVYEPGGNRIELIGDIGYLIFDPEYKPLIWDIKDVIGTGESWIGADYPESFRVHGTPATVTHKV
jgi:catechol 2,3-dioxygenase